MREYKVRDLVNFTELKRTVVQVQSEDPKELVSTFVTSDSLREQLKNVFKWMITPDNHRPVFIIGDYGTGKSHLLGFLKAIAENWDEMVPLIHDTELREYLENNIPKRDFFVIFHELGPTLEPLGVMFYYEVKKQMKEKYGIELDLPVKDEEYAKIKDHKELIVNKILKPLKEKFPNTTLFVAFDELSDFIRQKKSEGRAHDGQFIRILGELSQRNDMIIMFAMQESIFKTDMYKDQADEIKRELERYEEIIITKEEVEKVISQRILPKSETQRKILYELFSDTYKKFYPEFEGEIQSFIELYPIHPRVIDYFKKLPYFQKRGILNFVLEYVKRSLDENFPYLITPSSLFDFIARDVTLHNKPNISNVNNAVGTLIMKIKNTSQIKEEHKPIAISIVKLLGVYKLIDDTKKASIDEIINDLLIIPSGVLNEPYDFVGVLLRTIGKVTSGQYISHEKRDGILQYWLDLEKKVDPEDLLEARKTMLSDEERERHLFDFIVGELLDLDLREASYFGDFKVIKTFAMWPSKNSYRDGLLILERKTSINSGGISRIIKNNDFALVLVSPYKGDSSIKSKERNVVIVRLRIRASEEEIKRYAAIKSYLEERQYVDVFRDRLKKSERVLQEKLLEDLIENSNVIFSERVYPLKSIISNGRDFYEVIEKLKSKILDDYFTEVYKEYPTFRQVKITHENIKDIAKRVITNVLSESPESYSSETKKFLKELGLYEGDELKLSNNKYVREIERVIGSKNYEIAKLFEKMYEPPFGLQKEITGVILSVLMINDEVLFRNSVGELIGAEAFLDILSRKTLDTALEVVKYVEVIKDFPTETLEKIFRALHLNPQYIRVKAMRTQGLKEFRKKISELLHSVEEIKNHWNSVSSSIGDKINLPIREIEKRVNIVNNTDLIEKLNSVQNVRGFEKIKDLPPDKIEEWINEIDVMKRVMDVLHKKMGTIEFMVGAKKVLEKVPDAFRRGLYNDLLLLYDEIMRILESDKLFDKEKLQPISGKIDSFKVQYKEYYTEMHNEYYSSPSWNKLFRIYNGKERKELEMLSKVLCVNGEVYNTLEKEMLNLINKKCNTQNVETALNFGKPICSCEFPDSYIPDFEHIVDKFEVKLKDLKDSWEKSIVEELRRVRENLQFLSSEEAGIVREIIENGKIEYINDEVVNAINKMFTQFEVVEISIDDIIEDIGNSLLTPEELKRKLVEKIAKYEGNPNVRIKIVSQREE